MCIAGRHVEIEQLVRILPILFQSPFKVAALLVAQPVDRGIDIGHERGVERCIDTVLILVRVICLIMCDVLEVQRRGCHLWKTGCSLRRLSHHAV